MNLRPLSPLHIRVLALTGLAMATVLIAATSHSAAQAQATPPPDLRPYTEGAQPILKANCYRCHAGMNHRGGFQMDTHAGIMRGGHDGAVIVPGHPEQSLLIKLIRHEGPANDPMPMPPKSKLSDADIATITRWIQAGALMPPDPPAQ
jgi:cytochrome c